MEKKHARNFSLDVHPYLLTIRKPKVEATTVEPLPSEHNMDTVYLEGTHTIVHVSGAITGEPEVSLTLSLSCSFGPHIQGMYLYQLTENAASYLF